MVLPLYLKFGLIAAAGLISAVLLYTFDQQQQQQRPYGNERQRGRTVFSDPQDQWTNDRPNRNRSSSPGRRRRRRDGYSQKEILTDELEAGIATCNICLDTIEAQDEVFACKSCYNIFHLNCVKKWISSCNEFPWKCSTCRAEDNRRADQLVYTCMCGKTRSPRYMPRLRPPHCCSSKCNNCSSKCHPGACDL